MSLSYCLMYLSFYLCLNRAPDLHGPTESERKKGKSLSRVRLFAIAWTVVYQAPPSMGFSRQEYWSGLQFPSPGDLPDSGIKPRYPALQVDSLPSEPPGKPKTCIKELVILCWNDIMRNAKGLEECFQLARVRK